MNLLPRSRGHFQQKSYWDSFFSKRTSPFEWYGSYQDICHVLHKYIKPANLILVAGCGNSRLSEDLYDAGFKSMENVDISDVVIRQMASRNAVKRPGLVFQKMDLLNMSYSEEHFDCVVDKGTLDALFTDAQPSTLEKVHRMFEEVRRVLRQCGRYICITLAQEHILDGVASWFQAGWMVRVHKVELGDEASGCSVGGALPVFVFVMTKLTVGKANGLKVMEYVSNDGKCVRCDRVDDVKEFVKSSQLMAMMKHHLTAVHAGEQTSVDLWSQSGCSEVPRYTFHIVDMPRRKAKNGPFAIFVVPQGREVDWLFASERGREQLVESAGYERLVVVSLHSGHAYPGLVQVKEEVSANALEFAQAGLKQKKYPVLTLGDGIGSREVLHKDSSVFSGDFVVEEVFGESGERLRRLVFLSKPHLAQTEIQVQAKGKKRQRSMLCFDHHKAMVASLALMGPCSDGHSDKLLIVGLGGGALPSYIRDHVHTVTTEVIEIDEKMLEVAVSWFGLTCDERLRVVIEDGAKFITTECDGPRKGAYKCVMWDIDSKDTSEGLSSPPMCFLTAEILSCVKRLLSSDGIFVTNLAARNDEVYKMVIDLLLDVFELVLKIPLEEDVNDIIVCLPSKRELDVSATEGQQSSVNLLHSTFLKQSTSKLSSSSNFHSFLERVFICKSK